MLDDSLVIEAKQLYFTPSGATLWSDPLSAKRLSVKMAFPDIVHNGSIDVSASSAIANKTRQLLVQQSSLDVPLAGTGRFILDSGCNTVVTGDRMRALNLRPLEPPTKVFGAYDPPLSVDLQCDMAIECVTEQRQVFTIRLSGVLYHPRFGDTLISPDLLIAKYGWEKRSMLSGPSNRSQVSHYFQLEPQGPSTDRIMCVNCSGLPSLPVLPLSRKSAQQLPRHSRVSASAAVAAGFPSSLSNRWTLDQIYAHSVRVCTNMLSTLVSEMDDQPASRTVRSATVGSRPLIEWHQTFGHAGPQRLKNLMTRFGLPCPASIEKIQQITSQCTSCQLFNKHNMPRKNLPLALTPKSKAPLELLHMDTTFPVGKRATADAAWSIGLNNEQCILVCVDDFSRYVYVKPVESKQAVKTAAVTLLQQLSTETQNANSSFRPKIVALRSDRGREFNNSTLQEFAQSSGLRLSLCAPGASDSNGVVERFNKTLHTIASLSLAQSQLPLCFWPYAYQYAATVNNNMIVRHPRGPIIPCEARGVAPVPLDAIHPFGCDVIVYPTDKLLHVHAAKSKLGQLGFRHIYLGVQDNIGQVSSIVIYRPLDKDIQYVPVHRCRFQGTFHLAHLVHSLVAQMTSDIPELTRLNKGSRPSRLSLSLIRAFCAGKYTPQDLDIHLVPAPGPLFSSAPAPGPADPVSVSSESVPAFPSGPASTQKAPTRTTLPIDVLLNQLEVGSATPLNYHYAFNITAPSTLPWEDKTPIPKSIQAALSGPHKRQWLQAAQAELARFDKLGVLEPVPLATIPTDACYVQGRWVLTTKLDVNSQLLYKARFVARGDRQIPGLHFDETFSPTLPSSVLRLLLVFALSYGYAIHQLDVHTAFLYGEMDRPAYIKTIPGFTDRLPPGHCYRVVRALYGFHQSPRLWHLTLATRLKAIGYTPINGFPCVFTRSFGSYFALVGVYVDDFVVLAPEAHMSTVKTHLNTTKFEIRDLGRLKTFLGVQYDQSDNSLRLSSEPYVRKILADFDGNSLPAASPPITTAQLKRYNSDPVESPSFDDIASKVIPITTVQAIFAHCKTDAEFKTWMYQILGALRWVADSGRPDIAVAVVYASTMMHKPRSIDLQMVLSTLCLLNLDPTFALVYKPPVYPAAYTFHLYVDASWRSTVKSRSVASFLIYFQNSLISWKSSQLKNVSLSTADCEFHALTRGLLALSKLVQLLQSLGTAVSSSGTGSHPTLPIHQVIHVDNQAVLTSLKSTNVDLVLHESMYFHWVYDYVRQADISLEFIPSALNLADGLTKALDKTPYANFQSALQTGPTPL